MVELGIVDIREIIRLVNGSYNFDLSHFALTSLKYRLEHIISKNNLSSPEMLYRKLTDEKNFFNTFLSQLFVPASEMFRDPSVWRWLREEHFQQITDKTLMNYKIWLPFCITAGELYTICILLKEENLLDKVKIYATYFSDESLEIVKNGNYPLKKVQVSTDNYRRFKGTQSFDTYCTDEQYHGKRDVSLIKSVEFIKDDLNFGNAPKNVKMILMRNSMIYFKQSYQEILLDKIHQSMSASGLLIIGLQELINKGQNSKVLFDPLDINESIYKKRIG